MADRNIRALYPSCKPVMIYALADPRDDSLKYIGKSETPEIRRKHHIWESAKVDSPKCRWVNELLALGLSPELVILETIDPGGDWSEAEKRHIAAHRDALLNQCSGGQGVPSDGRGEKWRKALAASHVDNPKRAAGTKRMADKARGRPQSAEHVGKRSSRLLGMKRTPEHVAQMSSIRKGKTPSAKTLAAAAAVNKGRTHSDEHKEKRRAAMLPKREQQSERQRDNWLDPEYRQRVRANMMGRATSDAAREKLSETSKSTWSDPTVREKRTAGLRAAMNTPEWRAKRSELAKKLWSDPEFRARMKAARKK